MTAKTVLISGAARRIGAAIARRLHQLGYNTIIHYGRSAAAAATLAQDLNRQRPNSALTLQADLLDDAAYADLIKNAAAWQGRLDALINNASAFYPTRVEDTSAAQWNELIGTNMKAPFFLAQAAVPQLRAVGGCIINISDIHADRPLTGHPVYCAAKAGLLMLTKALAKELGPDIRVNAIAPGAILWPEDMDAATQDNILARIPLQKTGTPADIAGAVKYLLEDAGYVTGQVLAVDGGRGLGS